MNRRDLLRSAGAALALQALPFPLAWTAEEKAKKKILMYTRSQGFEHSVVRRGKNGDGSAPLIGDTVLPVYLCDRAGPLIRGVRLQTRESPGGRKAVSSRWSCGRVD